MGKKELTLNQLIVLTPQKFADKAGEDYDTRVSVPLELEDELLFDLMKRAHERDITLNQMVEEILREVIDSGYMANHNAIFDGEELHVNRFEVIDETGRAYTKYLKDGERVKYSLQDDDRTLKVFIDNKTWKDEL